ncbi:hypothetical protein [Prosthecobacter sp.]|uniref:hypothetical protein n=1 Tax=Prosthecobacter sp. TaxID=1965333 RepID=UPI0037840886
MGDSARTNIRTYRDSFQGIGCGTGCMIHLVLMGLIGVGMVVWLITIRAWELRVTVELPVVKKAEGEEKVEPRGEGMRNEE